MTEQKWTSGPLKVERAQDVGSFDSFWVSDEEERLVAVVPILGKKATPQAEADAHRFAASPVLYEALMDLYAEAAMIDKDSVPNSFHVALANADSAMRKARGGVQS